MINQWQLRFAGPGHVQLLPVSCHLTLDVTLTEKQQISHRDVQPISSCGLALVTICQVTQLCQLASLGLGKNNLAEFIKQKTVRSLHNKIRRSKQIKTKPFKTFKTQKVKPQ